MKSETELKKLKTEHAICTFKPFIMKENRIIGILIKDRIKEAGKTQKVLSKYASIITTRLGTHQLNDSVCSRKGVIMLHLGGDESKWDSLETELNTIGGIEVQKMSFVY